MSTPVITEAAKEAGVTMAQVEDYAQAAWATEIDGMQMVIVSADAPPALAGSVARYLLGTEVEFSHLGMGAYPVYRGVSRS